MNSVIQSRCACMDSDLIASTESNEEDSEEQAEQDEVLFEYAGDILPSLGLALNQPEKFKPYFAGMLAHLVKKTKAKCTTAEKSFAAGSLAECMEPLHGALEPFVPHIMPIFLKLASDEDDDVRNNAIFGLGELVLHSGPNSSVFDQYSQLLAALSKLLADEKAPRVLDQIVGAVCRLILANQSLVPLDSVIPVIFQHLPLREDFDEYEVVYKMIALLLNGNDQGMILQALPKIIGFSVELFNTDEEFSRDKVMPAQKSVMLQLHGSLPEQFNSVIASLPSEQAAHFLAN